MNDIPFTINYFKAVEFQKAQKYKKALQLYHKVEAESHNAFIQFILGNFYTFGWGISADAGKAFSWYLKAARQDHAESQYKVGLLYCIGKGTAEDRRIAFEWIKKAAEQDLAEAQFELSIILELGDGVPEDTETAHYWMVRAANLGYKDAIKQIEWESSPRHFWKDHLRSLVDFPEKYEDYLLEKFADISILTRDALSGNDRYAQKSLGLCYAFGVEVPKNTKESHRLMEKNNYSIYEKVIFPP